MSENVKIPYLPYVSFNQIQATELGLNHTQAILMNYFAYFLPNFGVVKIINGNNYYWLNYNKIFSDIPTLNFKEQTLRNHINKFIKEGLLLREVKKEEGNLPRAFYRATKKFLIKEKKTPLNFNIVYNNIELLLQEARINSIEKNKLDKLFSSYKGSKTNNSTTYNLEGIGGSDIMDFLKKEFSLSSKGEGVSINVGTEINEAYIIEHIFDKIRENGKNYGWIEAGPKGDFILTDEIKGKILGNLVKMFQWLKDNNKTVKSFKGQIGTWFGKRYI